MYILDTNVVSELRRADKADRKVATWAETKSLAQFFLSAITVLELELGVLQAERRDPTQGGILRTWLKDQIEPRFEGRILAFNAAVARRCAKLHVPDPRSERDAIIAATALVHGMTVVTRNVSDFAPTRVDVLNPWE